MVRRFVLKKRLLTRYENRSLNMNCEIYKQPLEVGQKIVSRPIHRKSPYTKHYHSRCFESLYLEVKD